MGQWQMLRPRVRRFTCLSIGASALALWLVIPTGSTNATQRPERRAPQADSVLEIRGPDSSRPALKLTLTKGGRTMTLIRREFLKVINPDAASGLTAVDVWADGEETSVRVRLSMIYNDLSNQEWWKDKNEKILGTYVVQFGQAIRPAEMSQFGLEPFEMMAVSSKPVVFPPGKGPRIINNTTSLVVDSIEKSVDMYSLLLTNRSNKDIVAYSISVGRGSSVGATVQGAREPLITGGGSRWHEYLSGRDVDTDVITIAGVVFADDSFEGDEPFATGFLAQCEGIKLQAPNILLMVQRALSAEDDALEAAFESLEADLSKMQEAIDKGPALELLRTRFKHLDEPAVARLYEGLKGGLYEARNRALGPVGEMRRQLRENAIYSGEENRTNRLSLIRRVLERTLEEINRIVSK